jgi:hypothetical protein
MQPKNSYPWFNIAINWVDIKINFFIAVAVNLYIYKYSRIGLIYIIVAIKLTWSFNKIATFIVGTVSDSDTLDQKHSSSNLFLLALLQDKDYSRMELVDKF